MVKVSFQQFNVPIKLTCFNTYSSTAIQTICTLVGLLPCTIAYMLSAAHLAILREANQRIKNEKIIEF